MNLKSTSTVIKVTITLNLSEAEALRAICGNIGGSGPGRTLFDDLATQLDHAGIDHKSALIDKEGPGRERYQALYFR